MEHSVDGIDTAGGSFLVHCCALTGKQRALTRSKCITLHLMTRSFAESVKASSCRPIRDLQKKELVLQRECVCA